MPPTLTDAIRAAVAAPARDASGFDVRATLADVLACIGERPEDCGGAIRFRGADPIVPSTLRLGAAAGIALVAKSIAIAKLARMRGMPGQDIAMDMRRAPHRPHSHARGFRRAQR